MATQEEINRVIESTDMVDLVSPYVKLTRQGKSFKGLCPFHNEDTPSFVVSQEKHLAHCFGCGKGGNPIKFLMEIKQVSFNEALAELAKKNGISIDIQLRNKKEQDYSKYYEIMQLATKYYHQNLTMTKSGKKAIEYLHKRGLSDETIQLFQIGLAPSNLDSLYQVLKDANYLEFDMMELGLVGKSEKGYYDLFTRRITFPISDENGNIIGFSARIFDNPDKTQPKYVNTKDTFLYRKGNILYHLDQAKSEILKKKRAILHEGQMDVISATNAGFKETICTMGTALTLDQAYMLKRYTQSVVICYDGDKAGIQASKKAIPLLKQAGIEVHLVLLPEGMDPDEYIGKYGKEAYLAYFDTHLLDEMEYLFEAAFLNQDLSDSLVLEVVKKEAFGQILSMSSQTAKEKYLQLLAERIKASLESVQLDYNAYCKITPPINYPFEEYPDSSYEDIYETPVQKIKEDPILKRNFELRLFSYARHSKERALEIDKKLNDYMDALQPINQKIWSILVDEYYMRYNQFDDATFCSMLTEEQKRVYLDNIEQVRGTIDVYSDEDLARMLERIKKEHYKSQNKQIDTVIYTTQDTEIQAKKLAEKFENKRKIMPTRRK